MWSFIAVYTLLLVNVWKFQTKGYTGTVPTIACLDLPAKIVDQKYTYVLKEWLVGLTLPLNTDRSYQSSQSTNHGSWVHQGPYS